MVKRFFVKSIIRIHYLPEREERQTDQKESTERPEGNLLFMQCDQDTSISLYHPEKTTGGLELDNH